MFHIS